MDWVSNLICEQSCIAVINKRQFHSILLIPKQSIELSAAILIPFFCLFYDGYFQEQLLLSQISECFGSQTQLKSPISDGRDQLIFNSASQEMLKLSRTARKYFQRFSSQRTSQGFKVIDSVESKDLNLQIDRLYHENSGAYIYNVKNSDSDNTFSPIVKTLPEDDTGCPHILEHLACCGSQKYPIRDPFFNMLKRSVNTYMNAWTGDDFTAYPFSSANPKDFNNLYSVYLDMSLKPLLNELDFRQQGWRWEFTEEKKQLKGIVLNEMKGAYQNPERQLVIEVYSRLYGGTPFGYDSGGKPESVVKLSYQQVRNMHAYYYHPSNMSFYYYGNQDISQKLDFLNHNYLKNYSNEESKYNTKTSQLLSRLKTPSSRYHQIQAENLESPSVLVTYHLGQLKQIKPIENICLNILSYMLLHTNQAVLYQDLIESGLADSFGFSGYQINTMLTFGVYLMNSSINEKESLQKIQGSLGRIVENGIDLKRLEEYVHQTELHLLTPQETQGIQHLQTCLPFMNNRLPLFNLMSVRKNLSEAVQIMKNKQKLSALINKFFLSNEHKVSVHQVPASKKEKEIKIIGLDMEQSLIRKQQKQLKERQQAENQNSSECLPKMKIQDLKEIQLKDFTVLAEGSNQKGVNVRSIHVSIDNPNIHFLRVGFKLKITKEKEDLLRFLHLWSYTINKGIGVEGLTNKELSSELNSCSKDFNVKLMKASTDEDPDSINIVFYGSCLTNKVQSFLKLVQRVISQPVFQKDNISNIFRNYKAEMVEQLMGTPIAECLDHCSSFVNKQGRIFDSYFWMTEGIKIAQNSHTPHEFKRISEILFSECEMFVSEHSTSPTKDILSNLSIAPLNNKTSTSQKQIKSSNNFVNHKNNSISITHTFDVNFCCQQYPGPDYLSQDYAYLDILLEILEQDYLHPKIREKGGAYGARAALRETGAISFYSYMDPYGKQTYSAFDQSVEEILSSTISEEKLAEAKIKILGQIDRPIIPQQLCTTNILKNVTNDQKRRFRQFIMEAKSQDVLECGKKYLKSELKQRVVFGKDVPEGFEEKVLDIPKRAEEEQEVQST